MTRIGQDTLNSKKTLQANGKTYHYFDINAVADKGWGDLSKLPFSLKVLLENLLRFEAVSYTHLTLPTNREV